MTREEREIAVKEFKEWRDSYYNKNKLPATMFIEEAIKALEQEPCEVKDIYNKGYTDGQRAFSEHIELCKEEQEPKTDGDCISRQAVLDAFWKLDIELRPLAIDAILNMIDNLPSINPKEPKTGWIPVKTRPMTEEETEHYSEYTDMRIDDTYTILDCPLPDDGQEVLVSWGGNVMVDVFVRDNDGCYFEGVDIDEVDAWMPLPEPYKVEPQESEDKNV